MRLIGNPVKFGDGPAAVTPPFLFYTTRGTLLAWMYTTVRIFRDGKVADRGGESENLPEQKAPPPWIRGMW